MVAKKSIFKERLDKATDCARCEADTGFKFHPGSKLGGRKPSFSGLQTNSKSMIIRNGASLHILIAKALTYRLAASPIWVLKIISASS